MGGPCFSTSSFLTINNPTELFSFTTICVGSKEVFCDAKHGGDTKFHLSCRVILLLSTCHP